MTNNFIKVKDNIINIDSIKHINSIREHFQSEFYFRIWFKNVSDNFYEVQYKFEDWNIDDVNKEEFLIKLQNEHKRLENYLLDGLDTNKKFFISIDLKK